jgi:hypothetical protein
MRVNVSARAAEALQEGKTRFDSSQHRRDRGGGPPSAYSHQVNAIGILAACQLLDMEFHFKQDEFSDTPDLVWKGQPLIVRTTQPGNTQPRLKIKPEDHISWLALAMRWKGGPTVEFVGWCIVGEGIRGRELEEPQGWTPAYFIPYDSLHTPESLFASKEPQVAGQLEFF